MNSLRYFTYPNLKYQERMPDRRMITLHVIRGIYCTSHWHGIRSDQPIDCRQFKRIVGSSWERDQNKDNHLLWSHHPTPLTFILTNHCSHYLPHMPSLSTAHAIFIRCTYSHYPPHMPSLSDAHDLIIHLTCLLYVPHMPSLSVLHALIICHTCLIICLRCPHYLSHMPSLTTSHALIIHLTCPHYPPHMPSLST